MRLLPSVALPRSALFAAVAVTVLAMPGTVGAQISSTGTVSDPVGPGNTNIANTLKIGNSINTGSILVENNSLLEAGTNVSQGQHSLSVRNGALNIQTGGDVTAISSISVNGTGTITVDGSGSTLSSQNAAIFVGGSSTGVLNVQNSASVTSGQFSIGSNSSPATGDGTVNLSGSGSTIDAVIVNVGESGFGRLNISDNAVLTSTRSNTFGENSGNNAILNIQSGGKFIHTGTGSTRIGQQGASATITVDGAGSQLIINDLINMGIIGGGNGGTIDVTNGGTASFQSTLISQGTINVNGTNSSLSTGQESLAMGISPAMGTSPGGNVTLNIGDNPGTIGVESAGTVNSVTGTVSGDITSTVTANVSGANAHWNLLGLRSSGSGAQLTVGSRGIGTLNINNQGTVTIDAQGTPTGSLGGISVGGQTGGETSTGTVNLDGTGASLVVVSGYGRFGERGTGTVNVANGATLDTSGTSIDMIARKTTSTGTVSVTGAGSTWNAGNNIHIGSDISFSTGTITGAGGNGTLNVANNGAVFVQDIFNAASGRITGGGGTITGNIQNDGTIAAGNSAGLMSIVGNLDHNAGATIEVEIGGTTFNTGISQFDYDRIDVSDDLATTGTTEGVATIDLAAIFSVEFIDGFSAASGDSFDILIADTIVGLITAANFVLPALTAGLEWDGGIFDVSGRDAIRIFVTESAAAAVPEPSSLLILIGGLGLLITARRRRAVTIH